MITIYRVKIEELIWLIMDLKYDENLQIDET